MRSVCQYSVYASTVTSRRDLSDCILPTTLLLWEDMSVCISVYASAIKRSVYQYSVYASTVTSRRDLSVCNLYTTLLLWEDMSFCISVYTSDVTRRVSCLYCTVYLLYTSDGMRILGADMERPCFGPPQHSRIFALLIVSLKKERKKFYYLFFRDFFRYFIQH